MFIIGLYHKVLIPLPHKIQICTYGQNQINPIKGFRTLGVGNGFPTGRQPLLSDALSCRLKSTGLSSKAIGLQTEMSHVSVNSWVKRFLSEGIDGLQTRPGRGRKPIMDYTDEEVVRKAIEQDRQSVSKAREAWQKATGKEASDLTFKRFLSALAQDISE